ncbi:MAG: alanine--tRNA ligase [Candidatus Omnitrophota bacterium]
MLSSTEIRNSFVEFFKERGHAYVAGASLVPPPDSTLLFTNAGMNQFVDYFKGTTVSKHSRIVNYQRCMRVSGKHNDLLEVGVDHTHHTLFEMMGNWSIADYGKKESIVWAWDYLTKGCGLPKEKLWVTIFREDDEAEMLWKDNTDVVPSRIRRFGEKENFWEMGETGPCGPCSEIHIDIGEDRGCGRPECEVNCTHCNRHVELWNLVFIQYERQNNGSLVPLKNLFVDTGLGLERLVCLLQGTRSNYDTDLFTPVIRSIESLSGIKYESAEEQKRIAFRVLCDHVRALSFLIADGIMPANDGRGYVLRKVLRRSVLHGRNLGFESTFIASLIPHIIAVMKEAYPYLTDQEEVIKKVVTSEEERFHSALHTGLRTLDEEMASIGKGEKVLPGDVVFRLADTYGVPIDFIEEEIAPARGLKIDRQGYEALMQEQRARARQARKAKDGGAELGAILADEEATRFTGYDHLEDRGRIVHCLKGNEEVPHLYKGETGTIVLDRTPFYAESGGQIGDAGVILSDMGKFEVSDTQSLGKQIVLHIGKVVSGKMETGAEIRACVDAERRANAAHHHTATHLMNYALRQVLGGHVKQSGSLVTPDYLRFDFTHYEAPSKEQLKQVEEMVNALIRSNQPVAARVMKIEEAKEEGALAFFGDKYGDVVRVVGVGDFSKEFCGGTHVKAAGDIGAFFIVKESAISTGVRRIEAVAGAAAYARACGAFQSLRDMQNALNVGENELLPGVNRLLDERKQLSAQNEKLLRESAKTRVHSMLDSAKDVDGVKVVAIDLGEVDGNAAPILRDLGDDIVLRESPAAVAVLAARSKGRVNFIVRIGVEALNRGMDANKIIRGVAQKTGGSGGGRKDMAQGGSANASQLKEALEAVPGMVKELLCEKR